MYRILLVSDTHGNLDRINRLAEETQADFVIHAGDFGFYDEESSRQLSTRELRLLITHSPWGKEYPLHKQTEREILTDIVLKHHLLGDFPEYLAGKKQFSVPVYAVWGNHEDAAVIRKLREGMSIRNLHLLDENHIYEFLNQDTFEFSLYGLGGNFLANQRLFDRSLAGQGGKVWSTLHQFGVLYQTVKHKGKASIFVSHVSPGKEPLLTALMVQFMPNFWVSGHMGAPYTCVWNQFTIREMEKSLQWLNTEVDFIEKENQAGRLSSEAALAYGLIKQPPPKGWSKQLWNINLPDIKDGHALLIFDGGKFSLKTESH
ncbi:MAG: metallophosphoesterase [Gammaproteobacteria bacterium]|nr:metallophosphoesterase [Gammaproteobacteria bacterium]